MLSDLYPESAQSSLQLPGQLLQTHNAMNICFRNCMAIFRHLRNLFDIARNLGSQGFARSPPHD